MEHKYQIEIDKNSRKNIVIENVQKITEVLEEKKVTHEVKTATSKEEPVIAKDKDGKEYIIYKKEDTLSKEESEIGKEIFFYDEYRKANTIVENIKENLKKERSEKKNSEKLQNENFIFRENNIISFLGDRGTGKTSAMVSFAKYLEEKDDKAFKVLDIIDPSYFRKNESILLNVITLLFTSVKKHSHKIDKQPSSDLLKEFAKVFKVVKTMDENIPQENTLEYLDQLSDSLDLHKSIKKLIDDSLDFFCKEAHSNKDSKFEYLVLMIDDLDTNVSHAPRMLEQIRKFLLHEKVILLISANIDQLQLEMKEFYSKYFMRTFNPTSQTSNVGVDVEDMATKYLLKLFPPRQRIHISNTADKLIHTSLKVIDGKDKDGKDNLVISGDLQKVILSLIWEKTRLIFIPQKDTLHPIIPTNLRALSQFIYTLIDMKEVVIPIEIPEKDKNKMFQCKDEYDAIKDNFYKFKDYILNVWIPSNVTFEEQKVFDNVPQEIGRINKHFIQSINVIGAKNKERLLVKNTYVDKEQRKEKDIDSGDIYTFLSINDPKFTMANRISDPYNYPSSNSLGDILLLADKYRIYFEAANESIFIEAVKIYYSLLLFETMFFDDSLNFNKEFADDDGKHVDFEKYRISTDVTNIQKLIGGTLYFPHYCEIIKNKEYANIIRCIKELHNTHSFNEKYKRKADRNEHLFYHECQIDKTDNLFFILYYGKSRPERYYRTHIYDTLKVIEDKEVRFDTLSLLVNILNPFHTLYRYYNQEEYSNTENQTKAFKEYKQSIEEWICKFEKEKVRINILLPIYSVDLMLIYLKKQVDYDDFWDKNSTDYSDHKKKIKEDEKEMENLTKADHNGTSCSDADRKKIEDLLNLMEEKIRDIKSISNYYDKLNDLTKKALDRIDNKQNSISKIYENIYITSKAKFLKSFKMKKQKKQATDE